MPLTAGRLVGLGALAGGAGGAISAAVLALLGEGPLGRAIQLEPPSGEPETFTRGTQQIGGALGVMLVGVVIGVVFAVAYAYIRPRLRAEENWVAALQLAGAGFVTIYLLPFLRYPSNPPGVGDPDTIGRRTTLYLLAIVWSAIAAWAAARAWRMLVGRPGPAQQALIGTAGVYLGLVIAGLALLPPSTDPLTAPANLIWQFRLATLAGAAGLWAGVGVVFGWLVDRSGTARVSASAIAGP